MAWDVEYTDEFGVWWDGLNEAEQIKINAAVRMLEKYGPDLPYPISSGGDGRWYEKYVPVADRLYDRHLEELKVQSKKGAPGDG